MLVISSFISNSSFDIHTVLVLIVFIIVERVVVTKLEVLSRFKR
jgi:hypothetical protein